MNNMNDGYIGEGDYYEHSDEELDILRRDYSHYMNRRRADKFYIFMLGLWTGMILAILILTFVA